MGIVRREDECTSVIREGHPETVGMTRMLEVRENCNIKRGRETNNRLP